MNPIQTETKGIRTMKYSDMTKNDLSYYTYLKDVRYQVEAHFIWNDNRPEFSTDRNENKHHNIAKRMIEKGGRRDIYLGTRECGGYVEPCVFGEGEGFYDNIEELDLGMMYHGITYPDEATIQEQKWFAQIDDVTRISSKKPKGGMSVRLWRCVMRKGVIEFLAPENCIHRPIREIEIKEFGKNEIEPIDVTYERLTKGEGSNGII